MSAELIRAGRGCVGAGSCESTQDSEAHTLEHLWGRALLSLIFQRKVHEPKNIGEAGSQVFILLAAGIFCSEVAVFESSGAMIGWT